MNFIQNIFAENKEVCTDLFKTEIWNGELQDGSRNDTRVYVDFYKFCFDIMKIYKPDIQTIKGLKYISATNPEELSEEEQQDVREMIEAVLDTIHYAKYKRSKKHE